MLIEMLGQGTFGTVTKHGNTAVKKFKKLSSLVQEVFITSYISRSPQIIKLMGCDFKEMTMTTQLWKCSLADAIGSRRMTLDGKVSIMKDLLVGVAIVHGLFVVHADLRSSNILVNSTYDRAVIVDFGLSSTNNCAKVHQTTDNYQPQTPSSYNGHDMYGLAVSLLEMFSGNRIGRKQKPSVLRRYARENMSSDLLARAIVRMVPDNPRDAVDAKEILSDTFRIRMDEPSYVVSDRSGVLTSSLSDHIKSCAKTKASLLGLCKSPRYVLCVLWYLSKRSVGQITSSLLLRTIEVMALIWSSVFGPRGYDEKAVLKSGKLSEDDIFATLADILGDTFVVDYMFAP